MSNKSIIGGLQIIPASSSLLQSIKQAADDIGNEIGLVKPEEKPKVWKFKPSCYAALKEYYKNDLHQVFTISSCFGVRRRCFKFLTEQQLPESCFLHEILRLKQDYFYWRHTMIVCQGSFSLALGQLRCKATDLQEQEMRCKFRQGSIIYVSPNTKL